MPQHAAGPCMECGRTSAVAVEGNCMMKRDAGRRAIVLAGEFLSVAGVLLAAAPAGAFTTDARRLGMASAVVPGSRDLASVNVAYQAMPSRRDGRGFVVPLPLGLVQLAQDFPTFDANDPDFSVTRLANLAINPPFFMETQSANELSGDISLTISRNSFAIYFEDAQSLLPQEPLNVGTLYERPLVGLGLFGVRSYLAPVVSLEGRVAFDDALYGVLSRGEPLLPNSSYSMNAGGESMGGAAFNAGYAGGGWGREGGDGLYFGAFTKYIMGFGFGKADTRFSLATSDTIFGDSNPLDVGYDATTRVSRFGNIGNGMGFDTGVAYRVGGIDLGVGVRDLAAKVRWGSTEVEHSYLDPFTDEVVTETVATNEPFTSKLPTQTTFNVSWTGARTILAADLSTNRWGTEMHAGAERRVGPLALRGGVLTDEKDRMQYAWGAGVGLAHVWVDVGFQTHNRTITGERGLTLGTSLAIR